LLTKEIQGLWIKLACCLIHLVYLFLIFTFEITIPASMQEQICFGKPWEFDSFKTLYQYNKTLKKCFLSENR